ncbi:sugar transporter [Sinirhodobacter populi]|uniref:Sugar transporter n=2 Tax=Paenirhodobacter populi TaxID=2306993 RepID=A0A443J1X9_9RHOB|nr:sugar transporter [Sinirhodobacter populi]
MTERNRLICPGGLPPVFRTKQRPPVTIICLTGCRHEFRICCRLSGARPPVPVERPAFLRNAVQRRGIPAMKSIGVILLSTSLALGAVPAWAEEASLSVPYLLGPQDKIMVRVHSLRRNTGEAYPWTPLNGEFSVGADGTVSMPILGRLTAAGGTTESLATDIGEALKETASLSETPSVAVEVLTYRPFFIMGAVQQPGKYEFEPGLTVLQAISIAQGFLRSADVAGIEREVISAQGQLRALGAEQIGLEAQLVRLGAEAEAAEELVFPADLTERSYDPRVVTAMREETQRFHANRDAVTTELTAIEDSKKLLEEELVSLDEKNKAMERQYELLSEQVRLSTELRDRGLTPATRQIDAENSRVSVQSIMLDVQLSKLRAQQSLSRASRDAVDVQARYRKTALDDLTETRALLEQNHEKTETARQLLQAASLRGQEALGVNPDLRPIFRLVRQTATGPKTSTVEETAALQPGDVLQVNFIEAPAPDTPPGQ